MKRSWLAALALVLLAVGLALYLVGTVIGTESWLRDRDPFPGIADVFYGGGQWLLLSALLGETM